MEEKKKENLKRICIPGQRICRADTSNITGGKGTYTRQGYICASLAGYIHIDRQEKNSVIHVKRGIEQNVVPEAGSIVTVKITSVNPRVCKCSILCVEDTELREPFRGQIRKEDVRSTEKDLVELYKCFRPGDIVLARVLSIGDAHSYFLSTAEDELGVVISISEAGVPMIPGSAEMQCPKTYVTEPRKVAKVIPEHIAVEKKKA
ncbi:exosome complex component CSL4-like [Limulus polyphemus]|uniref:Exosome complex component CSL4-like n=1 Tax=Limulus polyphemus TaxID=6850 RepID=A0ABM1BFX1_LIMPO|nr:exosome complex component CSL4-like [Limulus polyphemus]